VRRSDPAEQAAEAHVGHAKHHALQERLGFGPILLLEPAPEVEVFVMLTSRQVLLLDALGIGKG
jgi:hypothetical protein